MGRRALLLTAVVLVFSASKLRADVIAVHWVGGIGQEGKWLDSQNWDPPIVPDNYNGITFNVRISYGVLWIGEVGTYISVDHITNSGTINVEPECALIAQDSFTNLGHIKLIQSSTGCDDNVFENHISGVVEGGGLLFGEDRVDNRGLILATPPALMVYTFGSFRNLSTGTLRNSAGATLYINAAEESIDNQGIMEVNSAGAITINCNLVNKAVATIRLLGGTLSTPAITQNAEAGLTGFGGITGDVVIDPNGEIKLTGPTNIVGDVEIGENATLEISDGTTLITGHTTCNGTIHMKGGYIIPQGGLSGDCSIIWEPGLYHNVADFNLDGRVNFEDFAYFADVWLWQTVWP